MPGILLLLVGPSCVSGLCSTCLEERCYDNGQCVIGCVRGYVGKYCDEACPSRCLNKACHLARTDGTVTCTNGCEPGYCGARCTHPCPEGCETCDKHCDSCNVARCPERRYGADCSGVCSPSYEKCDRETGECIRCIRGKYGDTCNQECLACFTRADDIAYKCLSGCGSCLSEALCRAGFYGVSCELRCSSGCDSARGCNRATGECSAGCVTGKHGLACNYTCSEHCMSRRCDRATGECSAGCVSGYHGLTCNYTCSEHCLGSTCHHTTGDCFTGCVSGYHGLTCNYRCSEHCLGSTCHHTTGDCSAGCVSGYHGLACNYRCSEHCLKSTCHHTTGDCFTGCVSGYHGLTCNYTCSEHCLGSTCHHTTGDCSDGCVSGYRGAHCSKENNNLLTILLGLGICVMMVVVCVCVYLYISWRRGLRSCHKHKADKEHLELLEQPIPDDIEETARKQIAELRRRTKAAIETWTANMIQVSAVNKVVDMLMRGRNWVTITGNAGDGKRTLGYLVLKQLQGQNEVYCIEDPEEYKLLSRIKEDRVVLFLDSFGKFTSDQVFINKWKEILTTILNSFDHDEQQTKVVFVSRKNVLNEALDYLPHLQGLILDPARVVDLSAIEIEEERLQILDHYLKQGNVEVASEVKQRVAAMDIAHGFPHRSKMYSDMRRHTDIDIEAFFQSSLEFLNITTAHLYNGSCKDLFELLVKKNGTFDAYSVKDDTRRHSLLKLERQQDGSYITVSKNGVCEFKHPAIYESVVRVICRTDPLFCVKYVSLDVIRQKMTLTTDEKQKSPTLINVKPIPQVLDILAERLRPEILQGDYSIFRHRFCKNEDFLKILLSSCLYSGQEHLSQGHQKQKIDAKDNEGKEMLLAAAQGGKTSAVLALVERGADVNIPDETGNTPLVYICKQDDFNMKDARGMTILHYLCGRKVFAMKQTQHVVIEGRGDINQGDEHGITPLHWLCGNKSASLDEVKQLIEAGRGDINKKDDFGLTPLHLLCRRNADMKTLLPKIHPDKPVQEVETQLSLDEFWFNAAYERSLDDLVLKLQVGEKLIPVLGPTMTLSTEKIHARLQVEDAGHKLTNMARSGERSSQFSKLCGTCCSFVTFFPCSSALTTATYWETISNLAWKDGKEKVSKTLEMGVVEGGENLDKEVFVSRLPGSTSVCVEADCHRHPGHLCIQVWKRDQVYTADQVGECVTLPPQIHGAVHNVTLGLVLDVARGRVAFIDAVRGALLCKIDKQFTKEVIPMFGVSPLNDQCAIRMELVSGREISVTDKKKELILQALSD